MIQTRDFCESEDNVKEQGRTTDGSETPCRITTNVSNPSATLMHGLFFAAHMRLGSHLREHPVIDTGNKNIEQEQDSTARSSRVTSFRAMSLQAVQNHD